MGFIEKDKSVVAYSSFWGGFNGKEFDIDEDFKVGFYTNFDYGYMSYFRVCLLYKGVPIMIGPRYPRNDEFLQCYADFDGVYTPCYPVRSTLELNATREDWKKAMDGIAMIYNKLVVDFSGATVQAIVLDKEFSKTISRNYFCRDILMQAK